MGEKVKRANLPYVILVGLEKEAKAEFERLANTGLDILERAIMNTPPDPDEHAIIGTQTESLRKALGANPRSQHEQFLKDYERRLEYGAPLTPALGPTSASVLVLSFPFKGGYLPYDNAQGRYAQPTDDPETRPVPLSAVVAIPEISASELTEAFQGKSRKPPVAIKHPGTEAYTILMGGAEFLAARITRIPAMEMEVHSPQEVSLRAPTFGEEGNRLAVETKGREMTADIAYRMPSFLEPIAQIAREQSLNSFLTLVAAQTSAEEREAWERDVLKEKARAETWVKLYNEYRDQGLTEDAANKAVRNNPRWQRAEDIAEVARELRARITARWDELRGSYEQALNKARALRDEDGIDFDLMSLDPDRIWAEARKGQKTEETTHMHGAAGPAYGKDDEVEIRDSRGQWHPGVVTRVDGFDVRVRREDGQSRLIRDPVLIRRKGEQKKVDLGDEIGYNNDMDAEIRIPEFNVILPAGSVSLKLERELEPWTAEMNTTALKVNKETWQRNTTAAQREVDRLFEECRAKAGWAEFRPNAPADCIELFIVRRGLPPQRVNNKTGQPAMDKETLTAFQAMGDDLAGKVIEAREARSKLSQLESWEEYANAGTVQAKWNQLGTPHGRYSCDSPNLQNRIVEIRETIEAPPGFKFVSLDLGQAEYVTWASLSKDPTLTAAFGEGKDFHTQMFEEIHAEAPDVDLHEPSSRAAGKTINFALLYLMQPFVLAKRTGTTQEQAKRIIAAYERRAPVAVKYKDAVIKEIQRTGQASTHFGRTRYMPEIKRATGAKLHELTKTMWHHHNAGTAAEILKIKQLKTMKAVRREGFDANTVRMALQMHDEIILQVANEAVEAVTKIAQDVFNLPINGFLPFRVETRTGQNWRQTSK